MLLVTSSKSRQLLCVTYIGRVGPQEFQNSREELNSQLQELPAGFRLLADFSQLESMDVDCGPELGRTMELIGEAGVALVVRVIPDPRKDIGMNILTMFHYPHRPQVITCQNLREAIKALAL